MYLKWRRRFSQLNNGFIKANNKYKNESFSTANQILK